jgi:hypothetical protein
MNTGGIPPKIDPKKTKEVQENLKNMVKLFLL